MAEPVLALSEAPVAPGTQPQRVPADDNSVTVLSLLKESEPLRGTAFDLLFKLPDIFLANNEQKKR